MSTTEINDQLQVRRDKMEDLRQNGIDPFGQRFDRTHLSSELVEEFGAFSKEELEKVRRDIEKKSPFMNVKIAKIVPCVQNVQKRKKETINE